MHNRARRVGSDSVESGGTFATCGDPFAGNIQSWHFVDFTHARSPAAPPGFRRRRKGVADRRHSAARGLRRDRRTARRAAVDGGHPAHRVLAVSAGGRPPRGGEHRGPGVVRPGRDLLRHHRPRREPRVRGLHHRRRRQCREPDRRPRRPRHRAGDDRGRELRHDRLSHRQRVFADYLQIHYVAGTGELAVLLRRAWSAPASAFSGSTRRRPRSSWATPARWRSAA